MGDMRRFSAIAALCCIPVLASCNHSEDTAETATSTTASSSSAPSTKSQTSTSKPTSSSHDEKEPEGDGAPAEPSYFGSFSMNGPAPITNATYDSMPYSLPLNPAGPQETMVRWVDGWGQSPAAAEDGTVYVLGHAWGQRPLVFNPISEIVTANVDFNAPQQVEGDEGVRVDHYVTDVLNGSQVEMTSPEKDTKRWTVDTAYLVPKDTAAYDTNLINTSIPGRLVLIACSVDGANDLGYNVVVEAHLD